MRAPLAECQYLRCEGFEAWVLGFRKGYDKGSRVLEGFYKEYSAGSRRVINYAGSIGLEYKGPIGIHGFAVQF